MLISTLLYSTPPALAGDRLETVVRPTAQALDLVIDPDQTTFTGETRITFEVPAGEKVVSIPMHGEGLTIGEASLSRIAGWRGERGFGVTVTAQEPDRLTVTPDKPLRRGTYALTIAWEGVLHEQSYGLYRFEADGRAYVVSQLEADEARSAWPCFDEPSYKIPWTITVEHPADTVAISNAPIVRTRPVEGGQIDYFDTLPPTPSYALAVAVGPYVGTPVEGMAVPSKVWTTADKQDLAASAARDLPAITRHLEAWFGEPYPYAKLDLVGVPKFAYGAMENPGAIVYVEDLFLSPRTTTPSREHRLVEVSAHEVAHMWFGDLVTLAWWDDLWLNESFASFMGVHTLDALRPDAREDVARVQRLANMLASDGKATSRPVRTAIKGSAVFETSNFAAYDKGEAILDMIEQWLGPDTFRGGVRTYLGRHRWGNATFGDLVTALQDVSGEALAELFVGFLDQPGAPQLTVGVADGGVRIAQSRYAKLGVELPPLTWDLPIRLRVGHADGATEVVKVRLAEPSTVVALGDDVAWVHPAADGLGYWAWVLDEAGMQRLLAARDALTAAERRSIWGSLSLGLGSGQLQAADVLRAAEAFADEPDPALRRAILSASDMSWTIEQIGDADLLDRWHAWQRAQWRPWLEQLGEASPDEPADVRELREALLTTLARAGDKAVRKQLTALGRKILDDPTSVPFDLVDHALGVLAEDGDVRLYERLVALAGSLPPGPLALDVLGAAASIPDDAVRERVLERSIDPATTVPEMFTLVFSMKEADDDAVGDRIVDFTMAHYDTIAAKLPPQARMNIARIGDGCDMARYERTVAFFTDPTRKVEGTDRALAETKEGIEQCRRTVAAREASLRGFLLGERAER